MGVRHVETTRLLEVRIHGRGGQGNVAAAELLAQAAFAAGWQVQAFPAFGAERTGAPVAAFVRIGERPIRLRSHVYTPDVLVVQDSTLVNGSAASLIAGLVPDGLLILNAPTVPAEVLAALPPGARAVAVPATAIALETLGRATPNTTLLGAFAALVPAIPLGAVQQAVRVRFSGVIAEQNALAAARGYATAKAAEMHQAPSGPRPFRHPQPPPHIILTPGLVADPGSSAGVTGYHTGAWRVFRPVWDPAGCTDCDLCAVYCPESAVVRRGPRDYGTDLDFCKGCALCAEECPRKAITMVREDEARDAPHAASEVVR